MYNLKFTSRGAPNFQQGGVEGNPPPPSTPIAGSATAGPPGLFNASQINHNFYQF